MSYRQHEDIALFLHHLFSFHHLLFGHVFFQGPGLQDAARSLCVIAGNSVTPCSSGSVLSVCFEID